MSLPEEPPAQERQPEPIPEPIPDPIPEPIPEPISELMPDSMPEAVPEPPPYKPRRRGRTTALIAAALVLGVLAGGGAGYRIQQERKPTPLPPLTGPVLAQAKGAGPDVPALPVAQDRDAVYDGDLLKLLLPTPKAKGTKELDRRWLPLIEYADSFTKPGVAFDNFAENDFRRAATAEWEDARDTFVTVNLAQFRDEATVYTGTHLTAQESFSGDDPDYSDTVPVPGTVDAEVWGSAAPERKDGYLPLYKGRGMARIGNIFVDVFVDSAHPVKARTVMSLIKRQLERL